MPLPCAMRCVAAHPCAMPTRRGMLGAPLGLCPSRPVACTAAAINAGRVPHHGSRRPAERRKPWTRCAVVVEHSTPPRFSRANRLCLPINRAEPRRCARTTPSHCHCSTQPEPSSSSSSLHFHFPLFSYRGQTTHRSPRRGPHPSIRVAGEQAGTSSYPPTPPSWLLPPSTVLTPSSSQPWPPRRSQLPPAVTSTQITTQDTLPVVRGAFPLSPQSPTPLSRVDFELQ